MFTDMASFADWCSESYQSLFPEVQPVQESEDVLRNKKLVFEQLTLQIFKGFSLENLYVFSQVSKEWHKLMCNPQLLKNIVYRDKVFSAIDWSVYLAHDVKELEVKKAWESFPFDSFFDMSPTSPGKKLGETHYFFWIPPEMTMNKYRTLLKTKYDIVSFSNNMKVYNLFCEQQPFENSGWIAMSRRDIFEETESFHYQSLRLRKFIFYDQNSTHPKTLEAFISLSTAFFKFKIDSDSKRTRCMEIVSGDFFVDIEFDSKLLSSKIYIAFDGLRSALPQPPKIYITFDVKDRNSKVTAASVFRFNK